MTTDIRNAFLMAFQHLDAFSVPGVGTFRRIRKEAEIDHQRKRILPPSENFTLEKEEIQVQNLEDFFFRFLKVNVRKAKDMVSGVANLLREETQAGQSFLLPGIGEVIADQDGESFILKKPMGLAGQNPSLFGLRPVKLTLTERDKPVETRSKEEVISSVLASKGVPAEPVEPVRKRSGLMPIILMLLFVGAAASGIIFREEIGRLFGGGENTEVFADGKKPVSKNASGAFSGDSLSDGQDAGDNANTDEKVNGSDIADKGSKGVDHSASLNKGNKTNKGATENNPNKSTKVEKVPTAMKGEVGKAPVAGKFYLIVSSTINPDEAVAISRQQSTSAYVVSPPGGYGFYKVCVFESTDKNEVIRKMVEWKTRYSSSWIYYLGM